MREGWEVVPLGDVLTHAVRKVPVEAGRDYPIVGVLGFGRGLLSREPVSAGTTSYRELNAIGPDQVVYSKLKAFEGAITVTPHDLTESYASGEFPTFTVTERAIPAFVRLLTQRSELWARMAANSKGMGGRRERLSPLDFLTVTATFPPLSEQRRIVDLIGAVDHAIKAGDTAAAAAHRAVLCEADELFERWSDHVPLGDIAPHRGLIGGPFGSSLVSQDYTTEGVPVIRGANMSVNGPYIGGEFACVSEAKAKALVRNQALPGDVVFTQRGTLGQVSLVPGGQHERYVVSQSQMRLRVDEDRDLAKFVYYAFLAPRMVRAIEARNTATANPHINLGILSTMAIPRPSRAEQTMAVANLDALEAVETRARLHSGCLKGLRSQLLSALLSGEHEIPESYDELMEVTRCPE